MVKERGEKISRELASSSMNSYPFCTNIHHREGAPKFELKTRLIQQLPKFFGVENENPYHHLRELNLVCAMMKPGGVCADDVKAKAFLFSLTGFAKHWFLYQIAPMNSWNDMETIFTRKFIPIMMRQTALNQQVDAIIKHCGLCAASDH